MENIRILIVFLQVIRIEYYNSLINRNLGVMAKNLYFQSFLYCRLCIFFILVIIFPSPKKRKKQRKIAKEEGHGKELSHLTRVEKSDLRLIIVVQMFWVTFFYLTWNWVGPGFTNQHENNTTCLNSDVYVYLISEQTTSISCINQLASEFDFICKLWFVRKRVFSLNLFIKSWILQVT